jgi:hypothetical protein
VLPRSVLRLSGDTFRLKELPIRLSHRPSPVAIVTLRNRTLTPSVRGFIDCAREVGRLYSGRRNPATREPLAFGNPPACPGRSLADAVGRPQFGTALSSPRLALPLNR